MIQALLPPHWDLFLQFTFWILAVATLIQLFYYLFFYARAWKSQPRRSGDYPPVSVVIAARNEAQNLKEFLPAFLEQDYPEYQVVVIDDASTDNTSDVLSQMREKYPKLYTSYIPHDPNHHVGKKLALTVGVKAAKYDQLLFTDADCRPASQNWIRNMMDARGPSSEFVLGISPYMRRRGMLNRLVRWDAIFIAMQYMGFAHAGVPYMGVGRNLAYTKSFFLDKKGFAAQVHHRSGDDDLFVNAHAKASNVSTCVVPEGFTFSNTPGRFKLWANQKRRHFSAARYYRTGHKFLLAIEPFSRLVCYTSAAILLSFPQTIFWAIPVLGFRFLVQQLIFAFWLARIKELRLLPLGWLLDILMLGVHALMWFSGIFVKKYTWK